MKAFTEGQIGNWLKYEQIRRKGSFNMFDPRAQVAAGLNRTEYFFVMENYSELQKAAAKALAVSIDVPAHKVEGSHAEFDRYIAGDR